VKINFKGIGSAPQLSRKVFQVSASNRFETVVGFLRRKLGVKPEDSVICYINQVFAPGLDETVGGLFDVSVAPRPLSQGIAAYGQTGAVL
jgi:ubiquitin-like protein ATG12